MIKNYKDISKLNSDFYDLLKELNFNKEFMNVKIYKLIHKDIYSLYKKSSNLLCYNDKFMMKMYIKDKKLERKNILKVRKEKQKELKLKMQRLNPGILTNLKIKVFKFLKLLKEKVKNNNVKK